MIPSCRRSLERVTMKVCRVPEINYPNNKCRHCLPYHRLNRTINSVKRFVGTELTHVIKTSKNHIHVCYMLRSKCSRVCRTVPVYLEELVISYHPRRSLRSESGCLLCVPKTRTTTYGNRCFSKSAASPWNNLPMITSQSKSLN